MSLRPWQDMTKFERLLDNFGRKREAAGDAFAEDRFKQGKTHLEQAGELERQLVQMYRDMEAAANANRCVGCGEYGCGGACAH